LQTTGIDTLSDNSSGCLVLVLPSSSEIEPEPPTAAAAVMVVMVVTAVAEVIHFAPEHHAVSMAVTVVVRPRIRQIRR
jgi:hypothetical protein